jgi:hypothetical protein
MGYKLTSGQKREVKRLIAYGKSRVTGQKWPRRKPAPMKLSPAEDPGWPSE